MDSKRILEQYADSVTQHIEQAYHIDESYYRGDVKRGLRNNDGTGVLVGLSLIHI